ncbi:outer membrane protein assembly factor BamE domain-containing protein [Marinomonas spartinae]|uniref:outer membrane protein assembly factor BamE domain-containing protein n=1 Tax=Marinomonas spartinae TaxID=1792290 RepID=UPI0018F114FC|nr:outer membrane protein assembly factor BamE [Marinomonas spartinae]MBJ7554391.1 outer membrane protein assembly factor BamE [Marinomonas spartinae]
MRIVFLIIAFSLLTACSFINTKALSLQEGMDKQQVTNIMGKPIYRSFNGTTEAWQYAAFNGVKQCIYITVWFKQGQMVAMTNRQEPSQDQSCLQGIREIDWTQIPRGL